MLRPEAGQVGQASTCSFFIGGTIGVSLIKLPSQSALDDQELDLIHDQRSSHGAYGLAVDAGPCKTTQVLDRVRRQAWIQLLCLFVGRHKTGGSAIYPQFIIVL